MEWLDRMARGLLRPINPYATLLLGGFTAAWGLWVLSPFWAVFAHAALYSRMAEFAPEWAWGAWALCSGLLVVVTVFKGFYRNLSRALRFIGWHWATVATLMWWGDWQNTGGITYTSIMLYSVYCYLNININYVKDRQANLNFHL